VANRINDLYLHPPACCLPDKKPGITCPASSEVPVLAHHDSLERWHVIKQIRKEVLGRGVSEFSGKRQQYAAVNPVSAQENQLVLVAGQQRWRILAQRLQGVYVESQNPGFAAGSGCLIGRTANDLLVADVNAIKETRSQDYGPRLATE
jgi:hypothetical protein